MNYHDKLKGVMSLEGIIVRDDVRYRYTEEYLRKKGFVFHDPSAAAKGFDFIIFPFKTEVDRALYNDEYFAALKPQVQIFSGVRSEYICESCKANGLSYHVMMEDPIVAAKNAVPTSEGVIAYLIANRETTICHSRILVMGYGLCGGDLARKLAGLGAEVYALVRNAAKERQARVDNISPLYLNELGQIQFDVVINTIPGRVLTEKELQSLGLDKLLVVDIASPPYGFDLEQLKKTNPKSGVLSGIPGKYAVCSAGLILGEYIAKQFLSEKKKVLMC